MQSTDWVDRLALGNCSIGSSIGSCGSAWALNSSGLNEQRTFYFEPFSPPSLVVIGVKFQAVLVFPSGLRFPVHVSGSTPQTAVQPRAAPVQVSSRRPLANDEVTREQLLAALAEGNFTVWTKGENVLGYTDESPEVDLSVYVCEVCGRPYTAHDPEDAKGVGQLARFPGQPWEGVRCPPEAAPAS